MQLSDIRNPAERNKLILAAVLGLVALLFLWWTLFGFGTSNAPSKTGAKVTPSPSPRTVTTNSPQNIVDLKDTDLEQLQPINVKYANVATQEARRNIFVYYVPPPPPSPLPSVAVATPTPVPPVLLAGISPSNVYAKTGDFSLEVTGDKFTSQMRVLIDGTELQTRYVGPQQLSASVPGALIANAGSRQVQVRSADGQLYSNSTSISISAPPTPNYSYIGILGTPRHIDTAILLDKNSKETLNVQRGDLVSGRFRVTSISEKEIVFVDNNLKIKHSLSMTNQGDRNNPNQRPTPKVDSEDDEP
jgi:hypothetical protein